MKVTVCQLDNRPGQLESALDALAAHIRRENSDFLLLPQMWFFERARHFARCWGDLLRIPRATPHASVEKWLAGGQAAAVCAGAYCLSSNLRNPPGSRADCGGLGWIISPEGDVLARSDPDAPFATVQIDVELARRSKSTYPRYVAE